MKYKLIDNNLQMSKEYYFSKEKIYHLFFGQGNKKEKEKARYINKTLSEQYTQKEK
jgi:hypothetical protein